MKAIQAAHIEKHNVRSALNEFLLAYHSTPHPATGRTPSSLLYHREIGTKPESLSEDNSDQDVGDHDAEYKQRMKDTADLHRQAADQTSQPGDKVLLCRQAPSKIESPFHNEPCVTVDRHGDQVIIETPDGVQRRRNIAHTKPYVAPAETANNEERTEEEQTQQPEVREVSTPRRSQRVTQIPERFKDYVTSFR